MQRLLLLTCLFAYAAAVFSQSVTTRPDTPYKLELTTVKGSNKVQATRGEIVLISHVTPSLVRHHRLQIQSADHQIRIQAEPGETRIKGVSRGLHSFTLEVIDSHTGAVLQTSSPLELDIRRYIPR